MYFIEIRPIAFSLVFKATKESLTIPLVWLYCPQGQGDDSVDSSSMMLDKPLKHFDLYT